MKIEKLKLKISAIVNHTLPSEKEIGFEHEFDVDVLNSLTVKDCIKDNANVLSKNFINSMSKFGFEF